MVKRKKITASYHHSFAGGSKNTSRLLHLLSQNGCDVEAYFFEKPQFFEYTETKVNSHVLGAETIYSEVIDPSVIKTYSFTNKIIESLNENEDNILFGVNLFPYCNVLLDVKSQLKSQGVNNSKLILHPVGSDIWQIGPQIRSRVKWLLDNPLVDTIITYSENFANEISDYYSIKKEIKVLSPVLESSKFFPLSEVEKLARRQILGFDQDDFIIHHHSSMRKIKCPEIILDISMKSARLISENCILIMTGPIPYEEIAALNLNLEKINENNVFKYKTEKPNLTIYWTGVLSNVEYLLQIANVEINASLHDSFNLALMEAMACAVPVVTTDVVGAAKHILEAEAGYCFPTIKLPFDKLNEVINSKDQKAYLFKQDYAVDAIKTIAEDNGKSKMMGSNGAAYVISQFSPYKITNEFYKLIGNG